MISCFYEKHHNIMDPVVCLQSDVVSSVHLHKAYPGPGWTLFHCLGSYASCHSVFWPDLPYGRFNKGGKKFRDILIFGQLALLGVFPAQVLMTWGTQYSLASNAAILTLCLPVITAIFAFLMLKEKMNRIRWLSFIIAIIRCNSLFHGRHKTTQFQFKICNWQYPDLSGHCRKFILQYRYQKNRFQVYAEIEMVFYTYIVMVILLTPLVMYYEHDVFARIPSFTTPDMDWNDLTDFLS